MKKITSLFLCLSVMLLFTNDISAQEKAKTEITSVKQKGEMVLFSLTSSRPLIFGSNRYVLYIGEKEFTLCELPGDENNKVISFLISGNEFATLPEGAHIYLSYGEVNLEQDMETYTAQSLKCWSLGKFSTAMLTK